jgi:hypothetical protein
MKKYFFMMLVIATSLNCFAKNRTMSTTIPEEMQVEVTTTIDDNSYVVKPVAASVTEVDNTHTQWTLKHNKGTATCQIPVAYDLVLDLCMKGMDILHEWNIITPTQYNRAKQVYVQQRNK